MWYLAALVDLVQILGAPDTMTEIRTATTHRAEYVAYAVDDRVERGG